MPIYCMNKNSQSNGDHEVHDTAKCNNLPKPENRLDLGWHANCQAAVKKAKAQDPKADGCKHCIPECHTR